jgi:hypothetical protein
MVKCWISAFLQFVDLTGIGPSQGPAYKQDNTNTEITRPLEGFEPTITTIEQAKAVSCLSKLCHSDRRIVCISNLHYCASAIAFLRNTAILDYKTGGLLLGEVHCEFP